MKFFNAVLYWCTHLLIFELWRVCQKKLEIVENSICLSDVSDFYMPWSRIFVDYFRTAPTMTILIIRHNGSPASSLSLC